MIKLNVKEEANNSTNIHMTCSYFVNIEIIWNACISKQWLHFLNRTFLVFFLYEILILCFV